MIEDYDEAVSVIPTLAPPRFTQDEVPVSTPTEHFKLTAKPQVTDILDELRKYQSA